MIEQYVLLIQKLLVIPKRKLENKLEKKPNKDIEKVVKEYDKLLLDKYKKIEKMIEEELSNDN